LKTITVTILLALSILIGFVLGRSWFNYYVLAIFSLALALLSAIVLQKNNFDFVSGVAVIVVCLMLSQIAYMVGLVYMNGGRHC
jgi:hypothetical protein